MTKLFDAKRHRETQAYGFLLFTQCFLILVPALFDFLHYDWILKGSLSFVIVASLYIVTSKRSDLLIGLLLGLPSLIMLWAEVQIEGDTSTLISLLIGAGFFSFMGLKLAQSVAESKQFNLNTVLAAVTGYIIIGIIGGYLVELVQLIEPGAFNIPAESEDYTFMYYSFVTVTTLGYGDFAPISIAAKAVSIILAITGQIYLTVVIAMIIGRYISSSK